MLRFTCEGGLQPYKITTLVKTNSLKAIINPRPSLVYLKRGAKTPSILS